MICDRIREQITDCLAGRLDPAARERVIDHLETCSACRADVAELGVVWRGLEVMSEPEPSPEMRARFLETLGAYQEGYQDAQRRQALNVPERSWWTGFWPSHPAWQAAFSAVLIVAGILGGRYLLSPAQPAPNPEMAQLKTQVDNLRQLVALSLLQEQSPSSRLRGVTYSQQMAQPDRQVEQALLFAVNHDGNVNVRLSAVDGLARFAASPDVRRALIDAIAVQDSPLVQVALIDLLVQANAREAVDALRKFSQDPSAEQAVRQHARDAIQKLGGTQ